MDDGNRSPLKTGISNGATKRRNGAYPEASHGGGQRIEQDLREGGVFGPVSYTHLTLPTNREL